MMTACEGGLHHIFEKTLPQNPTLIQSLSWNQQVANRSSFTDIFGELRFSETHTKKNDDAGPFSSCGKQQVQMCTEGLGSESSDDVDDIKKSSDEDVTCWNLKKSSDVGITGWKQHETKLSSDNNNLCGELRRPRLSERTFPPPISSIGQSGKPGVCFKSYRRDGRFVLKEVRVPVHEFLHAQREDGRLMMQFVHPTENIPEEEDEEE